MAKAFNHKKGTFVELKLPNILTTKWEDVENRDLISFIVCPELKEMFLYKLTFTQWCTLHIAPRMKVRTRVHQL